MVPIRCNVVGPEGSGKTTLLKQIKNNGKSDICATIPTVGTYVEEIWLGRKAKCMLREFGGSMAPVWTAGYEDCHMMIYVVDASNSAQLSTATVLLMEALKSFNKPVLLFINRTNVAGSSLSEFKWAIRIDDLVMNYKVSILESGEKLGDGLDKIMDWIMANCAT